MKWFLFLSVFALFSCQQPTTIKTGYVDAKKVIKESNYQKELTKKWNALKLANEKVLQEKLIQIGEINKNLLEEKNTKSEHYLELIQQKTNILEQKDSMMQSLQDTTNFYEVLINNRISSVVNEYGKRNGFQYIFSPAQTNGILYGDSLLDITKDIITEINK